MFLKSYAILAHSSRAGTAQTLPNSNFAYKRKYDSFSLSAAGLLFLTRDECCLGWLKYYGYQSRVMLWDLPRRLGIGRYLANLSAALNELSTAAGSVEGPVITLALYGTRPGAHRNFTSGSGPECRSLKITRDASHISVPVPSVGL